MDREKHPQGVQEPLRRYFAELTRRLGQDGIKTGDIENGMLTIKLDGNPACGVTAAGDVYRRMGDMVGPKADELYQLTAEIASVVHEYLSSQLPLLKDNKWDADKQYKIAANVKTYEAGGQIGQALGSVAFTLPHSDELEEQYLAGDLLQDLTLKDGKAFRKEIEKICKEVFGVC